MKIKKISKINLITVVAAGAILSTPIAYVFKTSTTTTNLMTNKTQATNVMSISATETRTTSNWSPDLYQNTGGLYVYSDDDSIPKNNWIYQISKDGVTLNGRYPQYNKIQSVYVNDTEITIPEFEYPKSGVSMYSNYLDGEYISTSADNRYNLSYVVGGIKNNRFSSGVENFKTGYGTPFFKVDLLRWGWKYKTSTESTFAPFIATTLEHMTTSTKNFQSWDGNFGNYVPFTMTPNTDAVIKSKDNFDFEVTFDLNQVVVFNDYDLSGKYLNTYMYENGAKSLNSAFAINVDETKLDKSLPADATSLDTLSNVIDLSITNVPQNFRNNMHVELVPNNATGSISFELFSKYLVENGEIIINPNPTMAIASYSATGFLQTNTVIKVLASPAKIRVDEFYNAVAPGGVVNRIELMKYLDLLTVPPTAKIELNVIGQPNLITGAIELEFVLDKYLGLNGAEISGVAKFNLTMTLTPRITTLEIIETGIDLAIDDVINTLFDTNNVAKPAFYDYFKFNVTPINTIVTLKPLTVVKNLGDGLISFNINLSAYYNTQAVLTNNGDFKITDFVAWAPITKVEVKSNQHNNMRADYFVKTIAEIDGALADRYLVTDFNLLNQFITFYALPQGDVFIKKEPVVDKVSGNITFNLILENANDGNGQFIKNWTTPNLTLKLLPTPSETAFSAKTIYDKSISTDEFLAKLISNDQLDIVFLKQYVDFKGNLPQASILTIDNIVTDINKGEVSFNILVSQYYDANSVEQENGVYPISLTLAPKYNPTFVALKSNYDNQMDAEKFINYIAPNKVLNKTKLLEFIELNEEDLINEITIEIDQNDTAVSPSTGLVNLGLLLTNYYDAQSKLITTPGSFKIKIQLKAKAEATKFSLLPSYSKNLTVTEFISSVVNGTDVVRSEIQKYVFIENLTQSESIKINIDNQDLVLGTVNFTLSGIGKNADGTDFNYSFPFSLQLLADGEIPVETVLKTLNPDLSIYADKFISKMIIDDQVNLALLAQYVDLSLLPHEAKIAIKDNKITVNSKNANQFDFVLTYDKKFNGKSATSIIGEFEYSASIILKNKHAATVIAAKTSIAWEFDVDDLWLAITTKNKIDRVKILKYVDLSTLPPESNITANYNSLSKDTPKGIITLNLTVDKYYDENGDYFEGARTYPLNFIGVASVTHGLNFNDMLWIYITLGLVGIVIIISICLLVRRKRNARKFYDFKKDQY